MKSQTIGFIVSITIIAILFVILFIYFFVLFFRIDRFSGAIGYSVENSIYCVKDEGPCRLQSIDTLTIPQITTDTFSYAIARYAADLVARVELLFRHNHKSTDLQMPPNMINLKTLYYNGNIIGFVGQDSENTIWIVFRGTSTSQEWKQDFKFSQEIFTENHATQKVFSKQLCHKGFVEIYDSLKTDIMSVIPEKQTNIIITGHSLGAGLATLTTLDLDNIHSTHTYVFGSPRTCDFLEPKNPFYRINNTTDPIPDMPLSVMWNIRDKTNVFFYQHGGTNVEFTQNRFSLENNHLLPVYIHAIESKSLTVSIPLIENPL